MLLMKDTSLTCSMMLFCHIEQLCLSTKNLTNTNITCPINQIFILTHIVEHILMKNCENQAVFGNDIRESPKNSHIVTEFMSAVVD